MSSDSSSSVSNDGSTDQSPNPSPTSKPGDSLRDHLDSIALTEPNGDAESSSDQELEASAGNGSFSEETEEVVQNDHLAGTEAVVEEVSESFTHEVVWRENSEHEADALSSPSSSGYAGERGSSSATSESGIGDGGEDEICDVRNDDSVERVSDLQQSWVPGKRHVDEVSSVWDAIFTRRSAIRTPTCSQLVAFDSPSKNLLFFEEIKNGRQWEKKLGV